METEKPFGVQLSPRTILLIVVTGFNFFSLLSDFVQEKLSFCWAKTHYWN